MVIGLADLRAAYAVFGEIAEAEVIQLPGQRRAAVSATVEVAEVGILSAAEYAGLIVDLNVRHEGCQTAIDAAAFRWRQPGIGSRRFQGASAEPMLTRSSAGAVSGTRVDRHNGWFRGYERDRRLEQQQACQPRRGHPDIALEQDAFLDAQLHFHLGAVDFSAAFDEALLVRIPCLLKDVTIAGQQIRR